MKKILSFVLLCATILLASCGKDDEKITTIASVTLDQATLSLVEGETGKLIATITPADANVKDLTWMTCDKSVATVDAQGVVTAVGFGKATITVVTRSGGKSASCAVTVTAAPVPSTEVTLNKTTLSLIEGSSETLTATVLPEEATDKTVTWSSDKTAVATVDANGAVAGVTEGTAVITVKTNDSGKTATCTVTVTGSNVDVTGIKLNETAISIAENESVMLTATVSPANATVKTVKWSSNNTAIATVNETTGVVTGVAKGQAVVTATSTANTLITATCAVTVTEPAPKGMEIGDFYMSDGTVISKDATLTAEQKAQCVGIVLKVGKDATDTQSYKQKGDGTTPLEVRGYVLALKDADGGNTYIWGPSGVEIGTKAAKTTFDGYQSTQIIMAYAKKNSKDLKTEFPATYYATTGYEAEYHAPASSSGWFLPSSGQLKQWLDNRVVLLESIRKATDNSYNWKTRYWASSEYSNNPAPSAWYLDPAHKSVDCYTKDATYSVRSCLVF